MRRITFLIILTFTILLGIFLALSYISPFGKSNISSPSSKTKETVFYFNPDTIYSTCNDTVHTTDIYISTNNNKISSVQIELSFNPEVIYELNLIPSSDNFLGNDFTTQIEEVREQYGRATLALELNPNRQDVGGIGKLATLSFKTSEAATSSSQIVFLNKSTVFSSLGKESFLKETSPLTIYCQ